MDITLIKSEVNEEPLVKVENQDVRTIILQNVDEFGNVQQVLPQGVPYILSNFNNSDGNIHIAQVNNGSYTYIIENPEDLEEGAEFEVADGEHYIIEEYHGDYDESDDQQYETVYIQNMEPVEQGVETTQVYTVTEEINQEFTGDDQQDDDDDSQMAIVDEAEYVHIQRPEQSTVEEHIRIPPKAEFVENKNIQKVVQAPEKAVQKPQIPSIPNSIKLEPEQEVIYDDNEVESLPTDTTEREIENKENHGTEETTAENKELELIYECSICPKSFKTPKAIKRHIMVCHTTDKKVDKENDELSFSLCPCCGEPSDSAHTLGDFKCRHCQKLFTTENSFQRHISIEHPSSGQYECNECKKTFVAKNLLVEHMRVHPLKCVKCDGCGREFSRKFHLDRHLGHTGCLGLPKEVFACRVCSKTFTRKDNLAEHLKQHAGLSNKKKKRFSCEFCSKEFNALSLLNIHVRTHTKEKPYICDICEKRFPSSGAMRKHRRVHTGEKPYICVDCGKQFAAKETLNRHWRTHTGDKPHECKFCGKCFIQAAQLRAHIFHHTGENAYTCQYCNRAFNRKLRLTTHIKYMHDGEQPLTCPIDGCTKTFFRKEDVQRHVLTHTGEKPHKCDICDKAFAVKSSLKTHKYTHRKEPPVSCEVCSRAFIRQDCLMRHMRARHRDVLEDILATAEKRRLQRQLFLAVSSAAKKDSVKNSIVWNEFTLTESIKDLLSLLVDEECLAEFGHPEAPVDKVLESVIRRCGHTPASDTKYDYIGKMRENAKLLFTVVIDDTAVKELLNNQTVDEVIMHVLKLAKKQAEGADIKDPYLSLELNEENASEHASLEKQSFEQNSEEIEYDVDDPDAMSIDEEALQEADEEQSGNVIEYIEEDEDTNEDETGFITEQVTVNIEEDDDSNVETASHNSHLEIEGSQMEISRC